MLQGIEAVHVKAVFEDCADQLAVLGKIMPHSYEGRTDADEVKKALEQQSKTINETDDLRWITLTNNCLLQCVENILVK